MKRMPLITFLVAALLVLATATAAFARSEAENEDSQRGDDERPGLAAVRAATASFRDVDDAIEAGYARFVDAKGVACIDSPYGAMGIHYVKGSLIGTMNPTTPQALVYEPLKNGKLRLVAVEYIAFQSDWDATHASPPWLFGQEFMRTAAPNRYGIPAFYALHAWIWKHNPSGMFASWNPRVSCRFA
jgi:hypothetical protein